jgi:hypothetical protein
MAADRREICIFESALFTRFAALRMPCSTAYAMVCST